MGSGMHGVKSWEEKYCRYYYYFLFDWCFTLNYSAALTVRVKYCGWELDKLRRKSRTQVAGRFSFEWPLREPKFLSYDLILIHSTIL